MTKEILQDYLAQTYGKTVEALQAQRENYRQQAKTFVPNYLDKLQTKQQG